MKAQTTGRPRLAAKARLRFDRKTGREILLYPERGLELNRSAAAIARLLDGERTVGEIVDSLCSEFRDLSREVVERDVKSFIASLVERGLIEGEG